MGAGFPGSLPRPPLAENRLINLHQSPPIAAKAGDLASLRNDDARTSVLVRCPQPRRYLRMLTITATRAVITSSERRWLHGDSGYGPPDSWPGCILCIAAEVENALFCRDDVAARVIIPGRQLPGDMRPVRPSGPALAARFP